MNTILKDSISLAYTLCDKATHGIPLLRKILREDLMNFLLYLSDCAPSAQELFFLSDYFDASMTADEATLYCGQHQVNAFAFFSFYPRQFPKTRKKRSSSAFGYRHKLIRSSRKRIHRLRWKP